MTGTGWQQVAGRVRCTKCFTLVSYSWRYFARPGTWTLALCDACVAKETGDRREPVSP